MIKCRRPTDPNSPKKQPQLTAIPKLIPSRKPKAIRQIYNNRFEIPFDLFKFETQPNYRIYEFR